MPAPAGRYWTTPSASRRCSSPSNASGNYCFFCVVESLLELELEGEALEPEGLELELGEAELLDPLLDWSLEELGVLLEPDALGVLDEELEELGALDGVLLEPELDMEPEADGVLLEPDEEDDGDDGEVEDEPAEEDLLLPPDAPPVRSQP